MDTNFNVPNRPFRQVNGQFMMGETFQIGVSPVAKVVQGASQTAELLSHEQGHYNLGILVGWAMAREVSATSGPESGCSGHGDSKLLYAA